MTTALWCLLITMFLPIFCAGIAKAGGDGYDNARPRDWLARQEGFRARAVAAQQNSWEALIIFGLAVLAAHTVAGPRDAVDQFAVAFVLARVGYIVAYIANWALVRSLVWLLGLFLSISIFVAAA